MKTDVHRRSREKKELQTLKNRKKRRNLRQARSKGDITFTEESLFARKDIILMRMAVLAMFLLIFTSSEKFKILSKPCYADTGTGYSMASASYAEFLDIERLLSVKDKSKDLVGKITPIAQAAVQDDPFEARIKEIVKNAPMKEMTDEVAKRDKMTAAFLVGIAMKESKFGTYSPKKDGKECYNYWGYRGKENTTKSGYSCFDSPEHAVKVVGDRIDTLVRSGRDTPAKMIVWKCGSTCAGHGQASVDKWIADVGIHYYGLMSYKELAKR